jgi:hypothetical protein
MKLKGVLGQFKSFDVTPAIGREYENVNLKDWLSAPNSDDLLRDLAITSLSTSPTNIVLRCESRLMRYVYSLSARGRFFQSSK